VNRELLLKQLELTVRPLFENKADTASKCFILTKLNDGDPGSLGTVAAEHLNSFVEFDDKLTPRAFAVIAVNMVALDEDGEPVDSVGESVIIKRRVTDSLGGIYPFFAVLAGVTTGVVLECVWRNKEKGLCWQIQQ
jgi:hypothetical protein